MVETSTVLAATLDQFVMSHATFAVVRGRPVVRRSPEFVPPVFGLLATEPLKVAGFCVFCADTHILMKRPAAGAYAPAGVTESVATMLVAPSGMEMPVKRIPTVLLFPPAVLPTRTEWTGGESCSSVMTKSPDVTVPN